MNTTLTLTLLTALLFVPLAAKPALAMQLRVIFSPMAADPAARYFTNNHYVVVDTVVASRRRLAPFLPGTGAIPFDCRNFLQNAASHPSLTCSNDSPFSARPVCRSLLMPARSGNDCGSCSIFSIGR